MVRNFGGKIFWQIAEIITFGGFTLAVEQVLAIMIFIAKWLMHWKFTLLPVTWHTIVPLRRRNREQAAKIFLVKWPTTIPASVFTATTYTSFGLPSSHWQANSSPTFSVQNSLEMWCPRMQLSMVNSMPTITLARPAAGLLYHRWDSTRESYDYAITMTSHCKVLADEILADCLQNR